MGLVVVLTQQHLISLINFFEHGPFSPGAFFGVAHRIELYLERFARRLLFYTGSQVCGIKGSASETGGGHRFGEFLAFPFLRQKLCYFVRRRRTCSSTKATATSQTVEALLQFAASFVLLFNPALAISNPGSCLAHILTHLF